MILGDKQGRERGEQWTCDTPIAMDYRRVEPRFKQLACLFQIVLLVGLLVYIVHQVLLITSLAEDPPVNSAWKEWDGAGRWAICSNELQAAGIGIFNGTGSVLDGAEQSGWELLEREEEIAGVKTRCAIVDLSSWRWPQHDTFFNLCGSAPHRGGDNFSVVNFYAWSANSWKQIWQLAPTRAAWMQIDKRVHRKNWGGGG